MTAADILGVSANAGEEEIRAAYLQKVKDHPPDRSPEEFERIRDAFETLRDPRARARAMLFKADRHGPLELLIDDLPSRRPFVGPQAWRDVLKESRGAPKGK